MHRDHAPPDRMVYAAPRHLDSPQARAAPQPGRPVPPGCPAVPPSCLSDLPQRADQRKESSRFYAFAGSSVAPSFADARCTIRPNEGIRGFLLALPVPVCRSLTFRVFSRLSWNTDPQSNYNTDRQRTATGISRARTHSKWELYCSTPASTYRDRARRQNGRANADNAVARARAKPHDATATVPTAHFHWSVSNARTRTRLCPHRVVSQERSA